MTLDFLLVALLVLLGLWFYFFRLWRNLLTLERRLSDRNRDLGGIMKKTKTRNDIVTVCSFCSKVKDNKGGWSRMEISTGSRDDLLLSHGVCPECARNNWPDFFPDELDAH